MISNSQTDSLSADVGLSPDKTVMCKTMHEAIGLAGSGHGALLAAGNVGCVKPVAQVRTMRPGAKC